MMIKYHEDNNADESSYRQCKDQLTLAVARPLTWLRTTTSSKPSFTCLIRRDVRPCDIQQGPLGDCWFISAISAAVCANRISLLAKLFSPTAFAQINESCAICCRLCKDGAWQWILTDDRFPAQIDEFGRQIICCSRGRRGQLFVSVLEKVLARMCGGYPNIVSGRCAEGLILVSGSSACQSIPLDGVNMSSSAVFNVLLQAFNQRALICAMCANSRVAETEFHKRDLVSNHAYAVKGCKRKGKLIELINPWKPSEVKSLTLCDFMRFFDSVDICYVRDRWARTQRFDGVFGQTAFMITVNEIERKTNQPLVMDLCLHRVLGRSRHRDDGESLMILITTETEFFMKSDKANSKQCGIW
ncbi:hypothetical protein ACOME3_002889 [Neoechinorhynchus agilis]